MNPRLINLKVTNLLKLLPEITLPIKIEELVKLRGLVIKPYPLEDDISGLLSIENGKGTIGFNNAESKVRKRFTIAHELGHFELHKELSNLFIDKQFIYRSKNSGNTPIKQKMEKEANDFASAILMPTEFVKKEVDKIKIDLGNEEAIKELAKIFDVSTTAMYYRISSLGLI